MRVLITGGGGFLGAWVAKRLLLADFRIRIMDSQLSQDRIQTITGIQLSPSIEWLEGDIANSKEVLLAAKDCHAIVHLAGVLTPMCRHDPLRGAQINVIGTLNVFEAARLHKIARVIYTSSGGVFGPSNGQVPFPTTHYGAYKLANEGSARAYWEDHQIASIGMRPFVVYGPGRDSGLSAGPSLACRAAALGETYAIPFTGSAGMVYVDDVAAAYEAAVKSTFTGAHTLNLTGHIATMQEVVAAIQLVVPNAHVSCEGPPLPSAADSVNEYNNGLLPLGAERSLLEGVRETIHYYQTSGKSN
jgi:nucleoside-diphosphate-sugar epimerase